MTVKVIGQTCYSSSLCISKIIDTITVTIADWNSRDPIGLVQCLPHQSLSHTQADHIG